MADFELEQLKNLFDNLGDRLERTKGDQLTRDELYRMRLMLTRMANQANNAKGTDISADEIVKEFFREWKNQDPLKGLKERGPTQPRRTIIQEEKARRGGNNNTAGFTFLDRELRGSSQEVDEFGKTVTRAGKDVKGFGEKVGEEGVKTGAAFALFTRMFKGSAGVVMNQADQYRRVLSSGEGSIDSMQDLSRQTTNAGMTMKDFADAMTQNGAQGARALGGIRWLQLNKTVNEMTRGAGALGMTQEQLREASIEYADILRLQGMSRDRTNEDMARGMIQLVRSSETTANILGKTREEALAAAKEQASNSNVQASMQAQGLNDDQRLALDSVATKYAMTYGEAGRTLINDIIQFGQPLNKSATDLAATLPELQQTALNQIAGIKANSNVDVVESGFRTGRDLRSVSSTMLNDRARLQQYANMGALSDSALASNFTAITGGILAGNNAKTDPTNNAGSKQGEGGTERQAGIGILQLDELAKQADVTKQALQQALVNPLINEIGPTLRDVVNPALLDLAKSIQANAAALESNQGLMGPLAVGLLAATGALALFGGAVGMAVKGIGLLNTLRGGLGGLAGRGAGAAAGAGRAAGLARLAAPALGVAGGVLAGGYGVYAGGNMVADRQGESFLGTGANEKGFFGSRATGYGTSAASGALAGAAIGSVVPVIGTGIGAAVGGLAGLGYAWWNDSGSNASTAPTAAAAPSRTPQGYNRAAGQQPANATGQRNRNAMTADQMTAKIMEANERSANLLKSIKENGERQVETMREELAVMRGVGERLARLLEEGNRNTKLLADHSI
jgi:hypothetical protein